MTVVAMMETSRQRAESRRLVTLIRAIEDKDIQAIQRACGAGGANINGRDKRGMTPLMHAASTDDPQIVEAVLGAGADPRARMQLYGGQEEGVTALHFVYHSTWFGGGPMTAEPMRVLLAAGADPNDCNRMGEPLLYQYIRHMIRYCRQLGDAQQKGRDTSGPTLWVQTCVEVIGLLLAAGADPNRPQRSGVTPLMLTGRSSFLTDMLLKAGADPHRQDEGGQTALDNAEHPEVRRLLQEAIDRTQ